MAVAVFGSVNMDLAVYAPRLPRAGETLHGDSYALGLGGKGANQAVAAARLGARTHLIGRLGGDAFGRAAAAALQVAGVDTAGLAEDPAAATGLAAIEVDAEGQNRIVVVPGANFGVGADEVARLAAILPATRVLLLQLEVPLPAVTEAARAARAQGVTVILDPAPAPPDGLPPALLASVDLLTPNEVEAEALLGRRPDGPDDARAAAEALRALGPRAALVTLGDQGVAHAGPEGSGLVPAWPVTPVDSTAAGDAFNGALAQALDAGMTLISALDSAAAASAWSVTRRGAAPSLPDADALAAFRASRDVEPARTP